jgi:hypothetical protein
MTDRFCQTLDRMGKAENAKSGRVNLIEDPAEIARWDAKAKTEGLSLSAWIRRVCRLAVGTPHGEEKKGEK